MKEANLISIVDAYERLSSDLLELYLKYHSINIKKDELKDLKVLVNHLKTVSKNAEIFDKYFIGYTIPQISKEFDLLRIGKEAIINIEIKSTSTPEKIKTQLLRNKYYLSFLKKEVFNITYVTGERKLYWLDENQTLVEVKIRILIALLESQKVEKTKNIDDYFNPSNYLVSPFNSTRDFVDNKYFLTSQQEDIKKTISTRLGSPNHEILAIKGKAGTGKTLLTYDIAKDAHQTGKKVLTVHCGLLNAGHTILRNDFGWDVVGIKDLHRRVLSTYDLIIVDEAQRIKPFQLDCIIWEIKKAASNCIFSYDAQQTLRRGEIANNIGGQIKKSLTVTAFELTSKIRTNKEVASFILSLFDKNRALEKFRHSNIELNYFNDYAKAKRFLEQLNSEGWKIINYTPSKGQALPYQKHHLESEFSNAHTVIGQEFDTVVAVIDQHFYYKNGELSTHNYSARPYYHPTKMLWQIVSRTRIKLNVIIINNPEVLARCLQILNQL